MPVPSTIWGTSHLTPRECTYCRPTRGLSEHVAFFLCDRYHENDFSPPEIFSQICHSFQTQILVLMGRSPHRELKTGKCRVICNGTTSCNVIHYIGIINWMPNWNIHHRMNPCYQIISIFQGCTSTRSKSSTIKVTMIVNPLLGLSTDMSPSKWMLAVCPKWPLNRKTKDIQSLNPRYRCPSSK